MIVNEKRVFVLSEALKACISTDTSATVFRQDAATREKKITLKISVRSTLSLRILQSISVSLL